jgi:tetratricopeptide (TPR) repeat protein
VNAQIRRWYLQTAVDAAGKLVRQECGDELKVAHLHNQVRSALGEFGDVDKAPSHYEQALAIYLKTLGNNYPTTTRLLKYYEQALAIRLTTVDDNHPLTATSHSSIVKMYEGKHNYTNTLKNYERALTIHLMVLGDDHPDTRETSTNLQSCRQLQASHRATRDDDDLSAVSPVRDVQEFSQSVTKHAVVQT